MLACEDHIFICLSSNDGQHSPHENLARPIDLRGKKPCNVVASGDGGATLPTIPRATADPPKTTSAQQSPPPRRSARVATGSRK
eukprot:4612087-Prymnesium_polylepis.1